MKKINTIFTTALLFCLTGCTTGKVVDDVDPQEQDNATYLASFDDGTGSVGIIEKNRYDLNKDSENPREALTNQLMIDIGYAYFLKNKTRNPQQYYTNGVDQVISIFKANAEANAKASGISFDEAFKEFLDEYNAENEVELRHNLIGEEVFNEREKDYIEAHMQELTREWINIDPNGKFYSEIHYPNFPYDLSHIFINFQKEDPTNLSQATIEKIANVYNALAYERLSFEQVARMYSTDEPSKYNGGELGIMTIETDFIPEFKFGVYLADYILRRDTFDKVDEKIFSYLCQGSGNEECASDEQLHVASFEVFENLVENPNAQELLNKYVLINRPFYIVDRSMVSGILDANAPQGAFKNNILVDSNGYNVIGLYSSLGLHFVKIKKSPFDFRQTNPSLEKYYSVYRPAEGQNDPDTFIGSGMSYDITTLMNKYYNLKGSVVSNCSDSKYRLLDSVIDDLKYVTFSDEVERTIRTAYREKHDSCLVGAFDSKFKNLISEWDSFFFPGETK